MTNNIKLSDKTVLANFSISRWGGHRFDPKASDEIHAQKGAAADAGNYNKRLLPKGSSSKIDASTAAARDYHKLVTLPWLDGGVRILPATRYMEYASRMKDHRQEFEREVAGFLKEYPKLKGEAEKRLGRLYNEADYPTAKQLGKSFTWELVILPFPDKEDFRAGDIGIDDLRVIQADMQKRLESLWHTAMQDTGSRIVEVVQRMAERLKGYKPGKPGTRAEGTFKDSLVDNVRELAAILPSFNLTGDKKLGAIIDKMQKELCKHDADLLRDDDKLRGKVAMSADAILSAVADFIK